MKIAQSTCNNSVASLVVGDALAKQRRAGKGQGEVLVIGLGGGSLPIYLHEVFSFNVECVDLDETVIRLAKTHFGFQESSETAQASGLSHHSWMVSFVQILSGALLCVSGSASV